MNICADCKYVEDALWDLRGLLMGIHIFNSPIKPQILKIKHKTVACFLFFWLDGWLYLNKCHTNGNGFWLWCWLDICVRAHRFHEATLLSNITVLTLIRCNYAHLPHRGPLYTTPSPREPSKRSGTNSCERQLAQASNAIKTKSGWFVVFLHWVSLFKGTYVFNK